MKKKRLDVSPASVGPVSEDELFALMQDEAKVGDKSRKEYKGSPAVAIKGSQGKLTFNRAAMDELLASRISSVLLVRHENTLFIKGDKTGDDRAHKLISGKGGLPGQITGKGALKYLGLDLTKNWNDIPVKQIVKVEHERKGDVIDFRPGELVFVVDLPKGSIKP
jgi:hypothetical protein